jgi:hypothetical protein
MPPIEHSDSEVTAFSGTPEALSITPTIRNPRISKCGVEEGPGFIGHATGQVPFCFRIRGTLSLVDANRDCDVSAKQIPGIGICPARVRMWSPLSTPFVRLTNTTLLFECRRTGCRGDRRPDMTGTWSVFGGFSCGSLLPWTAAYIVPAFSCSKRAWTI